MVPPASHRVSRVPWYSGSYRKSSCFDYRAVTFCGGAFQNSSSAIASSLMICPQPQRRKLLWFGLFRFRSPLLTESNFFLFLRVLRCFSSPSSPRKAMYSPYDTITLLMVSFLIRKSPDHSLRATPRSLSQLITSFIGSRCQGIRPAPLIT